MARVQVQEVRQMKRGWVTLRIVILLVVVMGVSGIGLPQSGLAQGKLRIAVTAFENKVRMPWWDTSWRIGEGLAEMLTTELMRTDRFIVVERQALGDVVREQELGQSGLTRRETAAPTGQVLGAQVVVRGAVTEFEARSSGGGAGVRSRDVAFEGKFQSAHVALDLRLIDTSSGQVIASHHAAQAVPAAGGALGSRVGSVTFGGDAFFQTPIGQATRAAMQEAVQFILATLATTSPAGRASFAVVKVEGGTAYINAGANAHVQVGDVFTVYSSGEELIDPSTGLKLGRHEKMIGSIQITEVQEQFSVGTIRSDGGTMKRGDRVSVR
jgi:curli biogenesis system outer membrane secretion channel CsgG